MNMSGIFARIVALIGAVALQWRRLQGIRACAGLGQRAGDPGGEAARRHPDAQDAVGAGLERRAEADRRPRAQGQRVRERLDHPRWINVLPNGDVLIAEVDADRRTAAGACFTMRCRRRCGAPRRSASAPTASPCCATVTATALPKGAGLSWKG